MYPKWFLTSCKYQLQLQVCVCGLSCCEPVEYNEASLTACIEEKSYNGNYTVHMALTELIPQLLSNIWIANKLDCFGKIRPCWWRTDSW